MLRKYKPASYSSHYYHKVMDILQKPVSERVLTSFVSNV